MNERSANREPKHLSELMVPDVLFSGRRGNKNLILMETMSARPGSTTYGPERELKQLYDFATCMGIDNLVYSGPHDDVIYATIESIEKVSN